MRLPLNGLRTFEAVASRLSFSSGARALNVSPAAVSSQIRALEERLDTPLFVRRGRRISLTEAGLAVLPGVQRGLAELTQAVRLLQSDRESGVLNVSMLSSFLQKWLTPRLTEFYRTYPQIDLRINADDAPVDFDQSDFHAAIRFGRGGWPGVTEQKLFDDWVLPVCNPEMLARIGPIERLEDLKQHRLLHSDDEPWSDFFRIVGGETVTTRGPGFSDSASIVVAAEQGLGIGLARWSLVTAELAAGRLVRPVPYTAPSAFAYYFVAPPHYFGIPKVAQFRAWLEECCKGFLLPEAN